MSGPRQQERAIDPGGSDIKWWSLYEPLTEFGRALAYPCRWEPVSRRWIRNEAAQRQYIYSTVPGATAAADEIVPTRFSANARKWEVLKGAGNVVVRFKLTENLNTGGSAAAVIRTFNGAAYVDGAAIKVFDWWSISQAGRGMWQGVANMEGWCYRREANADTSPDAPPEYEIIWMEQYAFEIAFTLGGDLSSGSASASVDMSWEQGVDPGSTVDVHDDQGIFPQARTGAKGIAIRSEYEDPETPGQPYYIVIQCQQIALTGRAVLAEDMCDSGEFGISGFAVTSFSPFNQNIEPATAFNDFNLAGQADDNVWLSWDDTLEAYVITQVTHKTINKLPISVDWDDGSKCIKKTWVKASIMYCTEPEEEDVLCFAPCQEQAPE